MEKRGAAALETELPFDERAFLQEHLEFVTRGLGVSSVQLVSAFDEAAPDPANKKANSIPGQPTVLFYNLAQGLPKPVEHKPVPNNLKAKDKDAKKAPAPAVAKPADESKTPAPPSDVPSQQ